MSRPSKRFRSRQPLALASIAILSVAVTADASTWRPTTHGRAAQKLSKNVRTGKPVRLSDRGPLAALRTPVTAGSDATAASDVRMRSVSMPRGRARALVSVAGTFGAYQGGVIRSRDRRLHWAAWFSDPKGGRHEMAVGPRVSKPTDWHALSLGTAWNRPESKATLSVDGKSVAATGTRSLVGALPSTAIVGLWKPGRRSDRATVLVRSPLTTGLGSAFLGTPLASDAPLTREPPATSGSGTVKPTTTTPPAGTTKPATSTPAPTPTPTPTPTGTGNQNQLPPSAPTASAGPLPGTPIRTLDFETGDLTGWTSIQTQAGVEEPRPGMTRSSGPGRISVVRFPVAQGQYAARFETHQGDGPFCCGDRAELSVGDKPETEGQERWYEWNMLLETGFPWQGTDFQTLGDFHSSANGEPPLGIQLNGNQIHLSQVTRSAGQEHGIINQLWSATPLVNHWYTFRLHVKWSSNASVGFVQAWVDNAEVVKPVHVQTLVPGTTGYWKMGYYRSSSVGPVGAVVYDNFHSSQVP